MASGGQPTSATSSSRDLVLKPLPVDPQHHLVVTTARGVYDWNCRGTVELFSSSSRGIVTARKMQTDKDLLAVADSQVVVVHDVERGMQRTYRLKSEEQVCIRIHRYESPLTHSLSTGSSSATILSSGKAKTVLHHYLAKCSTDILPAEC